jgi:hypothetical protein
MSSRCWAAAADLVALVGLVGVSDTHQGCQVASGGFLATLQVATVTLQAAMTQRVTVACQLVVAASGGRGPRHSKSPRLA